MKDIEFLRKLWLGKKVISISNGFEVDKNDKSLNVGTIVDIIPISQSNVPTPLVQFEDLSESYICFSTLMEYSESLYNSLKKLTAEERWNILQAFVYRYNV